MAKTLVVEDEPELRELIVDELTDVRHGVESSSNGVDGFAAILRLSPDIVLAYINLPKMNGYEMRESLAENGDDKLHRVSERDDPYCAAQKPAIIELCIQ